ncbi:HSP20-like chaperone [Cantharellus anzutake]|uniref:HSP20-like chaperone n=1 Tax=Cantharellus anzutake TaxID=1750568 RepID=UPI001905B9B0|nr:HSP20-like chaperone [Cantharellus anzutake]KAF8338009.1 HSP20-like chaperone [Cantharellus anzutake]
MTKTIVRKRTLHQGSLDMVGPGVTTVSRAPSRLKRRKSRFHLKPNHDADYVTAVFDLPDVRKEDIHVAYQFDRLTITWESTSVFERQERDGTLVRERKERKYARTLPLPPGTPFSDVHAYLEDGQLSVTYPKFPATPLSHLPLRPVSLIQ